jgi:hypothetical protein
MAAHFISHDPAEEEVAWMTNSLVGVVTPGHRGDQLKIIWKRTDFSHPVLSWGMVLFKESPPSIMVTRNPNWSTEILWYGTGYVKEKILSPLKRSA